jgi:hypothetical protein
MLNKILLFLACFFGCTTMIIGFLYNLQSGRIDSLETSNMGLQTNNNFLIKKIEREHNDKVEISRKNQELENLAKRSVGFDWNRDISSDELVLWLHENAVRVQRDRARAD